MEDLESRCRLCGRKEGAEKFINIFDGEHNMNLDYKINKLLPIVVIRWDPLPHGICEPCFVQLNAMDKFYENSSKTDKFLKKLLPFKKTCKLVKIDPMLKIFGFNCMYSNNFKMSEKEENDKNNDLILEKSNLSLLDTKENIVKHTKIISKDNDLRLPDTEEDIEPSELTKLTHLSNTEKDPAPVKPDESVSEDDQTEEDVAPEKPTLEDNDLCPSDLEDIAPDKPAESVPESNKLRLSVTEEDIVPSKPTEPIVIDLIDDDDNVVVTPKRSLDCFLIRHITNPITEEILSSVYGCRRCYKTYTTELAAISHDCVDESPAKESSDKTIKMKIKLFQFFEGYFICDICKMSFTRKSALRTHLKQHIRESDETCEDDDEEEDRSRNKKRKKLKSKKRASLQSARGNVLSEKENLAIDKKSHVGGDISSQETRNNVDNVSSSGRIMDDNCNINKDESKEKKSSTPSNRNSEDKNLNEEESNKLDSLFKAMIVCCICRKVFLSRKLLLDHQKDHCDPTKEQIVPTLHSPPVHQLLSDEEVPKEETCQLCDKKYPDMASLEEHQKWHLQMSERILNSDRFKLPKRKRKRYTHSNDFTGGTKKLFSPVDKVFNKSFAGEELYICQVCNATFNRKSAFTSHEMTHIVKKSIYDFGDDEDMEKTLKKRRKSSIDSVRDHL